LLTTQLRPHRCAHPALQVEGVAGLLASKPSDWQVLKPSLEMQVGAGCWVLGAGCWVPAELASGSPGGCCGWTCIALTFALASCLHWALHQRCLRIPLQIDPGYLSEPQAIEFKTEGGLTAHMYYYPPQNKDFVFPEGERQLKGSCCAVQRPLGIR
jgi:hypothetical protein